MKLWRETIQAYRFGRASYLWLLFVWAEVNRREHTPTWYAQIVSATTSSMATARSKRRRRSDSDVNAGTPAKAPNCSPDAFEEPGPAESTPTALPDLTEDIDELIRLMGESEKPLPVAGPLAGGTRLSDLLLLVADPRMEPAVLRIVSPESPEYARICAEFALAGLAVVRIARVESSHARLCFKQTLAADAALSGRRSQHPPAILWHAPTRTLLAAAAEGCLDHRCARRDPRLRFGLGAYITPDVSKANQYAPAQRGYTSPFGSAPCSGAPAGVRMMLGVAVNAGNTYTYPRGRMDPTLTRPPPGYDSVTGNITGSDEVVVYDRTRTLVQYMVEYVPQS